jgi:predicted dehydrogenase
VGHILFDCAFQGGDYHSWDFIGDAGSLALKKTSASWANGFEITRQIGKSPKEAVAVPPLPFDPACDERVALVKSLAARFIAWQRGSPPARPDFADGLRVQQLIELARQSSDRGETVAC